MIMIPDAPGTQGRALEDRVRELELKHGEEVHRKS